MKNPIRTLWIGIFLSVIVLSSGTWLIHNDIKSQTLTLLHQQHKMNEFYIDEFITAQSQIIKTLALNTDVINYNFVKNAQAESLFYHFLKADSQIMQLRLIDTQGNEKIRFDRRRDGTIDQTPLEQLQNKSDRSYFKEFILLPENAIGFSKFDLNIEHGKVDIPFNPTLRIGIPIFKEGKKQGIVVINYYMNDWVKDLQLNNHSRFFLVDHKGYFLMHPDPKWAWSEYLSPPLKAHNYFQCSASYFFPFKKDEYRWINSNTVAFNMNFFGQKLLALYQPEISPNALLLRRLIQFSSIILLLLLLIIIPLVKIIRFNLQQIEEEKNKNKTILIHQSKLDAMGDMISAIAHQWRQPLNSIGLIMQDIVSAFNYGELDKEYLKSSEKSIMNQLQFMSQTIDGFRNFFTNEQQKTSCDLTVIIEDIRQLYNAQLTTYGITLEVDFQNQMSDPTTNDPFVLISYSAEIKQILLNLIANAKDAIIHAACPPSERVIFLSVIAFDHIIRIDVIDHAGGIKAEVSNRIFEPYFTTKELGTGLGLYIAKTLCEQYLEGSLFYQNDHLNGWSTFRIVLPRSINGHS